MSHLDVVVGFEPTSYRPPWTDRFGPLKLHNRPYIVGGGLFFLPNEFNQIFEFVFYYYFLFHYMSNTSET